MDDSETSEYHDIEQPDFSLNEEELFQFFENPLVRDDLVAGVDLQDLKFKLDEVLFAKEKDILVDYVGQSALMHTLYDDLDDCLGQLHSLEASLQGFHEDLVSRLSEISQAQDEVKKKKVQCNNYNLVAQQLGNFVNEVYLPENLIRALTKGKINQAYLEYLETFVKKINFIDTLCSHSAHDARVVDAIKEQQGLAKDLSAKVVEKIREWVLAKTSLANNQSLQQLRKVQKPLSKYGPLFSFLTSFQESYAKEVAAHYVSLSSRIYFENIKKKVTVIVSCYSPLAGYNDLLGEPEPPNPGLSTWNSFFNINPTIKNKTPIFSLGQRRIVLENLQEVFSLPSSPSGKTDYTYEMIFRYVHDNLLFFVKEESEFCKQFFSADFTDGVLSETIAFLTTTFADQLKDNYDVLGLLIVQGTVQYYQESYVTKSGSHLLADYFNNVTGQLQAKAVDVLRKHLHSLVSALEKIDQLGDIYSFSAHYITRRAADFIVSILALKKLLPRPAVLNVQASNPPNSINDMIQALCKALVKFVQKIVEVKFPTKEDSQEDSFFMINNFDIVVSLGHERGVVNDETVKFFEREMQKIVQTYSASLMKKHFSFLFNFVDKYAKRGTDEKEPLKITTAPSCTADSVEKIMKAFAENDHWKNILKIIDKEMKTKIANYERGLMIFQKLLALIFEYYSCFNDMVLIHFKDLRSSSYFIPKSEISYAMKNLTFYTEK